MVRDICNVLADIPNRSIHNYSNNGVLWLHRWCDGNVHNSDDLGGGLCAQMHLLRKMTEQKLVRILPKKP
jgi:hypothetical protein